MTSYGTAPLRSGRPFQPVAELDDLGVEAQDIRCNLSRMLQISVAALGHDIGVEQATLPTVEGVFIGCMTG
jgi:hypothetical protein